MRSYSPCEIGLPETAMTNTLSFAVAKSSIKYATRLPSAGDQEDFDLRSGHQLHAIILPRELRIAAIALA